ncbi:MAG: amidohydrolase family protein [Deltaproteobacteria bacterium]|jgi:cytosine/adenosine deaminase-related metal-dependent hydrolase|nr:amidohydrolase family protein [Deltaproteobacteria bacterium]
MQTVKALRARRILTLAEAQPAARRNDLLAPLSVLDNAAILSKNGLILAVEPYARCKRRAGCTIEDAGDVTLVPGLINAHSHVELAGLKGKTRLGQGFAAWAGSLIALRQAQACNEADMADAAAEMAGHGIVHAGDVSAEAPVPATGAFFRAGVSVSVFRECFGFRPVRSLDALRAARLQDTPENLRPHCALSGHALFSTRPHTLQLARRDCGKRGHTFTMHLAEHDDELHCLLSGTGPLSEVLRERGILPRGYKPPGRRPVQYAHELGLLGENTLAVHCVHCNKKEAGLLAAAGASVCLCPRSNAAIGTGGTAPVELFLDKGVALCLGTDSPASNSDMNLWNEARVLRDAHQLPARALLRLMTVNAARALRRPELGRLAPGFRAAWAALPEDFVVP